MIMAKMCTGTYITHVQWAHLNQNEVDPSCPIYGEASETIAYIAITFKDRVSRRSTYMTHPDFTGTTHTIKWREIVDIGAICPPLRIKMIKIQV